jgi:hypothetical protein
MLSLAVETADNLLVYPRLFHRITRIDHAFRQRREFFAGQSSFSVQLVSETNDADLVFRIESLDFFDDLTRRHAAKSIANEEPNQSPVHDSASNRRELRQKRAIKINRSYLQSNPARFLSRLQAGHTVNIFQK